MQTADFPFWIRMREMYSAYYASIALASSTLALLAFLLLNVTVQNGGGSIWDMVSDHGNNEYVTLAHSMLSEHTFILSGNVPDTFRTPGYPALLAATFLTISDSYLALVILHAAMIGLIAAGIAYACIESRLSRTAAAAAAVLYTLSSQTVFALVTGQGPDLMYTLCHVLVFVLILRTGQSDRYYYVTAFGVGILLAVATYARPIGLLGSIPLIIGCGLLTSSQYTFRRRIAACGIAAITFIALLSPWVYRNHVVTGNVIFSSLPAYNFAYYNIPFFHAFWSNVPEVQTRNAMLDSLGNPHMDNLRNGPFAAEMSGIVRDFLKEYAAPYSIFHGIKMIPFFAGSGLQGLHSALSAEAPGLRSPLFPTEAFNMTNAVVQRDWRTVRFMLSSFWLVTLDRIVWLSLFALALLAPIIAAGRQRLVLLLCGVIILSNAFLSSPVAQPRYRIPAEPFIWIAAAYTVTTLRQRVFANTVRALH